MTTSKRVRSWPLVVLLAASTGGCKRADEPKSQKTRAGASAGQGETGQPSPTSGAPAEDAPSPLETLLAITNLQDAIAQVKPEMTDTDDELSPGTVLFAAWAAAHLRWADVAVHRNETSFALVRKDSDAARGKRMCVRGIIVQISKQELGDSTAFAGLMLSSYSNILSFFAVGSTGDLVERSSARFCGVVIGTYDYSNSAGGKGHAVSVVGMFDLRENRKAAR